MVEFCEMCKLLNNRLKLEILVRVFESEDGINVGYLADDMQNSGLGLSGVSQYLKQLERLGVVRRVRAGRYVNYEMDLRRADPKVRTAVEAIFAAVREGRGAAHAAGVRRTDESVQGRCCCGGGESGSDSIRGDLRENRASDEIFEARLAGGSRRRASGSGRFRRGACHLSFCRVG